MFLKDIAFAAARRARERVRSLMGENLQMEFMRTAMKMAPNQFEADGSVKQGPKPEPNEPSPAKSKADVVQLPMWPEDRRGAPAEVLRSALFGVVKRGSRKAVEREILASWRGNEIRYTGFLLDQADLDCWLQALHLARQYPLGTDIRFTGRGFLRAIGRPGDGNSHRWLRRSLERMVACAVTIRAAGGQEYVGSLIEMFVRDEASGRYVLRVNPDLAQLFDEAFVRLSMERRVLLRASLARWLQGYIQSHRATERHPHRIGVERLRGLSGSGVKRLRKFREQLRTALSEHVSAGNLKRFAIISNGTVVEWVRCVE